jgi:hypothetical protein
MAASAGSRNWGVAGSVGTAILLLGRFGDAAAEGGTNGNGAVLKFDVAAAATIASLLLLLAAAAATI